MFGLALFFEPTAPLFLSISMSLLLVFQAEHNEITTQVLQLFSLMMITPLALIFGKTYVRMHASEEASRVLKQEGLLLENQIKKNETEELLWTTLELKNKLFGILDHISYLLSDISHLTNKQKEKLEQIRHDCIDLLKSGENLKETIDKDTD